MRFVGLALALAIAAIAPRADAGGNLLNPFICGASNAGCLGTSGVSAAAALCAGEADCFAIDATVEGGSVYETDGASDTDLASFTDLTNAGTSGKVVADDDGTLISVSSGVVAQEYDLLNSSWAMLVEAWARTNDITRSQQLFDASPWTQGGGISWTGDATTAPDGTTTADLATTTAASTNYISHGFSTWSGGAKSFSVWAKAGTQQWIALYCTGSTGNGGAWFDIINGVKGTTTTSTWSFGQYQIIPYANGWFRIFVQVGSTGSAASPACFIYLTDGDGNLNGNGTSTGATAYFWGAQLEKATGASSYIATAGSTVTRAADVVSIATSNYAFGSANTVYVDGSSTQNNGSFLVNWYEDDNNRYSMEYDSTQYYFWNRFSSSTTFNVFDTSSPLPYVRAEATCSLETGDQDCSLDGDAPTGFNRNLAAATTLYFGTSNVGQLVNGYIYRFVSVPRHVEADDGDVENWRYNF